MQIKAVFFDFGGTLADTPPDFDYEKCVQGLHRSFLKSGLSVPFEHCKNVYNKISEKYYGRNSVREVIFGKVITDVLAQCGYSKIKDTAIVEAAEAFMEPLVQAKIIDPHLHSVLRRLKKQYKLGVVSNFSYPPAVWKTLQRFDVTKFFDTVVVSADVGWRKPSVRIFKRALQALNVLPWESVFVGDELDHDVEGAHKVGMLTILLKKPGTRDIKRRIEPNATISELKETVSVLENFEVKTHGQRLNPQEMV
jgi:putative hydrolase of the HAD superfamily